MALRYPKDMGTEWMNLKQQVKGAFTSANSRVPYQKIGAGILTVASSLLIQAGAFMKFVYSTGVTGLYFGRHFNGEIPLDGFFMRRPDGSLQQWSYSDPDTSIGSFNIYDRENNIIFSDGLDTTTWGLGRPLLSHPFVDSAELSNPPASRQTTSTTDDRVVVCWFPVQHEKFVFRAYVFNPGGGTCTVTLKDESGPTLFTGTYASGTFVVETVDMSTRGFGEMIYLTVNIRRASGAGAVGITVLNIYGTP